MATADTTQTVDHVAAMQAGPVRGLRPLFDQPVEIDIDMIDVDPTNPGGTNSMRYKRRDPSIRDSYDILGGIVYPIIVCQDPEHPGRYIHVDGFGRLQQMIARGAAKVRALVYPEMSLEQRIVFRQTLNAAQEPFDVASIIRDLQQLALERGVDLNDKAQVATLVRDLPEKVRRYEKDLLILARWDPESAGKLGESPDLAGGTIGIDKLRAFERILDTALERHPEVVRELGGEQGFTRRLTDMYFGEKFSKGSRSQEAIRRVTAAMKAADENEPLVRSFFVNQLDHNVLDHLAGEKRRRGAKDLRTVCADLVEMLLEVDAKTLTDDELRILRRTDTVLQGVLA